MTISEIQAYFNQILYPHKKFDKSNIHHLTKFMLTKSFVESSFALNLIVETNKENVPIPNALPVVKESSPPEPAIITKPEAPVPIRKIDVPRKPKGTIFYPQQENSLFWCLYIMHYGFQKYELVRKHGNEELAEKQKIIDYLKTPVGSAKLKVSNHRITNAMVQEIISDVMMMKKKSGLSAVFGVAAYYNLPAICVVKGKLLMAFTQDKNIPISSLDSCAIIHVSEKNHFGFEMEPTAEKIAALDKYVKLESLDKPLKGISTYKVNDLDVIARKLDFTEDVIGQCNKTELYNKITEYMVKHKIGDF